MKENELLQNTIIQILQDKQMITKKTTIDTKPMCNKEELTEATIQALLGNMNNATDKIK